MDESQHLLEAKSAGETKDAVGSSGNAPNAFVQTPLRFVALGGFCLLSFTNAMQFIGFATVFRETRITFGASVLEVNLLATIFYICFVLSAPVTALLTSKYGLKMTIVAAAALNFSSPVLKWVCSEYYPQYWLLLLGQLLCSIPIVGILPAPPLLAMEWFSDKGRTSATTLCSVFDNLGIAFGMLLSPLVVKSASFELHSHANEETVRKEFSTLFVIHGVLSLIPLVVLGVLPSHPTEPPSSAAREKRILEEEDRKKKKKNEASSFLVAVKDELSLLFREGRVCLKSNSGHTTFIVIAGGVCVGVGWSLMALMAQALLPFGVSSQTCGLMGFSSIAAGAVSSLCIGWLVDRYRKYRGPLVGLLGVAFIGVCAVFFLCMQKAQLDSNDAHFNQSQLATVFVMIVVVGLAQISVAPIAFELLAEMAFPQDPAIGATLLMLVANAVAVFSIMVLPVTLLTPEPRHNSDPQPQTNSVVAPPRAELASLVFGALGALSAVALLCTAAAFKTKLARLQHEKEEEAGVASLQGGNSRE